MSVLGRIFIVFFIFGCSNISANKAPNNEGKNYHELGYNRVSFIRLITNPEKYEGKKITVVGLIRVEREATILALDKESLDYDVFENWISIKLTPSQIENYIKFDTHYVQVSGLFSQHSDSELFGELDTIELLTIK